MKASRITPISKFLFTLMIGTTFNLEGCARVFWDNTLNKACVRSMDLYMDDHPMFVVYPREMEKNGGAGADSMKWTSRYGSVVIESFNGQAATEGVNEKGLSAHLLYLEGTEYEKRDTRPSISIAKWVEYLVDNFSTVKEALDAWNTFQIISTEVVGRHWPAHACLEDVTGDSAIIEYIQGKVVIHHGSQFRVMTNEPAYDIQIENLKRYRYFGGTLALPGDVDPQSRFVRCSAFLKTIPEPKDILGAIGHLFGIIRTVQNPFGAEVTSEIKTTDSWPTLWTSLIDLSNQVYYFNSTSAPNILWLDFKNLNFSPKQSIKKIPLQNINLVGEVSSQLGVQ